MDPLRLGSSGANKQTPPGDANTTGASRSIPLAIRFNAGQESVEEILPSTYNVDPASPVTQSVSSIVDAGQRSLSSSPQLNSDDFNWRKDFLQSSFFHRKRSGSVEGSGGGGGTSPGSSLINNLSSSGDPNTVGTWKLIKGKVSQAMEDIKSKNIPTPATTISATSSQKADTTGGADSDPETATSDDISLDLSTGATTTQQSSIQKQKGLPATSQTQNSANDSDFDADAEILDIETIQTPVAPPSTIKRPFASLRAKTLSGPSIKTVPTKKPTTTANKDSVNGKEENKLFRRRKRDKFEDYSGNVGFGVKPKKDVEIESGVEMLEDMILPQSTSGSNHPDDSQTGKYVTTKPGDDKSGRNSPLPEYYDALPSLPNRNSQQDSMSKHLGETTANNNASQQNKCKTMGQLLMHCLRTAYKSRSIIVTSALLGILLVLPLAEFFRGVIACLFTISLITSITEAFSLLIERNDVLLRLIGLQGNGPEKIPFQIPDYDKLPICEIPAAEEHKPLKSYAGWMTEINNYDPSNFHISMTRPIYARLDGSILRISNTNARIPKRSMWNEQPIHRKNVVFTRHRCFNLLGCRVEMCPRGLARKRYFNRKYPIQLIINTADTVRIDERKSGRGRMETALQADTDISTTQDAGSISHQNSNESNDDHSDRQSSDFDFGTTVLHSNLQKLHDNQQQQDTIKETTVPCGDETRLLLFARCDREKEDWYRRFLAASVGEINDQELQNPDIVMMTDDEITAAIRAVPPTVSALTEQKEELISSTTATEGGSDETAKRSSKTGLMEDDDSIPFEGLIIAPNAARNAYGYIRFMSLYQKACRKSAIKIPVIKSPEHIKQQNRRQKKQDELWKGIDQTLFLGPSSSVLWANVLIGRVLYSCLNDQALLEKIQEFLQKKLSAIKLPSFMEDVVIAQTYLGDTPPLIHRVSQPMLDERGVWIDADITYEGLMHMTITTKLNLLRLKRQQQQNNQQPASHEAGLGSTSNESYNNDLGSENILQSELTNGRSTISAGGDGSSSIAITPPRSTDTTNFTANSAIYDSDAESTGASSSDSEGPALGTVDPTLDSSTVPSGTPTSGSSQTFGPGNSRRLLRIVDRITASNLFQSATEISYIQRAMENMSTKITLRVELKGLVARIAINLPPPPSDRIWIGFRGPPRLWISAKPAVGDHTFDWSIVTNVIESKLCDEVYKYLVYPNMVDIIAPFLGQSTYKE
ncbi:uncharacterized protein LOC119661010 isoform X4 [Hermetia illucens]|uniref:uncharacterized protein LOC119661010 isoform X4 n=1 Tax=Hermetia illucens TaxID=343691 RepID=UPI0018CC67F6|nr:uncharacterized protein LOC119661010 isoform X4 [Hermetia illucens]